jgi:hypothetical protein
VSSEVRRRSAADVELAESDWIGDESERRDEFAIDRDQGAQLQSAMWSDNDPGDPSTVATSAKRPGRRTRRALRRRPERRAPRAKPPAGMTCCATSKPTSSASALPKCRALRQPTIVSASSSSPLDWPTRRRHDGIGARWRVRWLLGGGTHRGITRDGAAPVAEAAGGRRFVSISRRRHITGAVDASIDDLAVTEAREGPGIARGLLDRAEAWAREQ